MRSFGRPAGRPPAGGIPLAMYQQLPSAAFLHVAYRPDSCLLIGRWLGSVAEEQLREGYQTMRLAALEHHCNHWLMDARRRADRSHNGPEWVTTVFLPQLQQELRTPLYVAFLVLPNHLRDLEENPTHPGRAPVPGALFQFARFIDEGAANAWLDQHRNK